MNQPPENIRPLRVIIIEEHRRVRQALADRLHVSPLIEIAASFAYVPGDPESLCEYGAQVVLLGLPQRSIASPQTMQEIISIWSRCGMMVIVLASFVDALELDHLVASGASQILLKQINTPALIDEIMEEVQTVVG